MQGIITGVILLCEYCGAAVHPPDDVLGTYLLIPRDSQETKVDSVEERDVTPRTTEKLCHVYMPPARSSRV